jgi:SAM-dependent methyltransferase
LERILEWRRVYDELYGGSGGDREAGFDIVGWNSSYTGEPLSAEEMGEQVAGTAERIAALGGRRVLEIGCGTGLLLFRLADGLDRYVGTDFSAVALERLGAAVRERGWSHVELWERGAEDFTGIEPGSFDVVVINSVVQYFPDMDYLVGVLGGAMRAVGRGGSVFVGDVRSLPLLRALHCGIELVRGGEAIGAGELRERVLRRGPQEQELVIDPGFFGALGAQLDDCGGVAIQVKRGWRHNELTRFRYDVVLQGAAVARHPAAASELPWSAVAEVAELRRRLAEAAGPLLLRGVPNARLVSECGFLDRLERADATVSARSLRDASEAAQGIEPERLWALGAECGWDVQVGFSEHDAGACDVLCVRRAGGGAPVLWSLPAPARSGPWSGYANVPGGVRGRQQLAESLRRHLRAKLPDYMIPASFVWLEALPLTPHGKVNHRALPMPDQADSAARPGNDVEAKLAEVWQEVLGLERVGLYDNFFDIGGHSLLLVRVYSRLTQIFDTALMLVDLYRLPTVSAQARAIAAERSDGARMMMRSIHNQALTAVPSRSMA